MVNARTIPEPGALVYDPAASKVGIYQAMAGPYVLLRPVGGGREWEADPSRIRPATPAERLSAEVKAANDGRKWNGREPDGHSPRAR